MSNIVLPSNIGITIFDVLIEQRVGDFQSERIERCPSDEQFNVLLCRFALGDSSSKGRISTTNLSDDFVDVLLVDVPDGSQYPSLFLLRLDDVEYIAGIPHE